MDSPPSVPPTRSPPRHRHVAALEALMTELHGQSSPPAPQSIPLPSASILPATPHANQTPSVIPQPAAAVITDPPHAPPSVSRQLEFGDRAVTPQHSDAAKKFLGKRIPANTKRANDTGLKLLTAFIANMHSENLRPEDAFVFARRSLFPDGNGGALPAGFNEWDENQLKRVRFFLLEFVVNYKSTKNNAEVKPSTMKGYLLGNQRAFRDEWGYGLKILEGPIFCCPREGLFPVIDNKFSEQQADGQLVASHNTLSIEDLKILYHSSELSKSTPDGFTARMVFNIGLVTLMRPSEIAFLTMKQVYSMTLRGKKVWVIRKNIGSSDGTAKNAKGGWRAVSSQSVEICVWNKTYLDSILNIHKDISEYMSVRERRTCRDDRFFLAINPTGKVLFDFYFNGPLGKNKLASIVRDVCNRLGITGTGVSDGIVFHSLRWTGITQLLEGGAPGVTVSKRSRHKNTDSLGSYHTLRGSLGENQQDTIFGGALEELKQQSVAGIDSENKPPNLEATGNVAVPATSLGKRPAPDQLQNAPSRSDAVCSDAAKAVNIGSITGGTLSIHVHQHHHYR